MKLVTNGRIVKLNMYDKTYDNGIVTIREVALVREEDGKLIKFRVNEENYKAAEALGVDSFVEITSTIEPNQVTDLAQIRSTVTVTD